MGYLDSFRNFISDISHAEGIKFYEHSIRISDDLLFMEGKYSARSEDNRYMTTANITIRRCDNLVYTIINEVDVQFIAVLSIDPDNSVFTHKEVYVNGEPAFHRSMWRIMRWAFGPTFELIAKMYAMFISFMLGHDVVMEYNYNEHPFTTNISLN